MLTHSGILSCSFSSFEPQRLTIDGATVRASSVLPSSHFDEEEHPWSTWQPPVLPLRDFCHGCPLLRQRNTCALCWEAREGLNTQDQARPLMAETGTRQCGNIEP